MPDGVHTLMQAIKPSLRDAPLDSAIVDPDRQQLPPTHHTMLPGRNGAESQVGVCAGNLSLSAQFLVHTLRMAGRG
jgi:hypothetical protein